MYLVTYLDDSYHILFRGTPLWYSKQELPFSLRKISYRSQVENILFSVGGEYTAIFSAVDEFLPPTYRGRVNIGIDGTWHLGGSAAAVLTLIIGETPYWRELFLVGLIGIVSLFLLRRNVPESPRWLISKQRHREAHKIIDDICETVLAHKMLLQQTSQPL